MDMEINLLPPDKKKSLRQGMVLTYIQTMVFLVFLTALFAAGTILSVRMTVKSYYDGILKQSEAVGSQAGTDMTAVIRDLNGFVKQASARQAAFIPWSEAIEKLLPLIPPGVRLESLRADGAGNLQLTGVAATRDASLELLRRLKETPFIKDVSSPLSNILQKTDVKFDFEMRFAGFDADEPGL